MARKSSGAKGAKGEKYNMTENARVGDIITASKSLAKGESYENGIPAHKSMHMNSGKSRGK